MKKLLLLLLTAAILSPKAYAQLKFSSYNKALIKQAEKENKLVFYEFTASWCGPCKMMKKDVFPNPKVGAAYNDNFICIQVDVDRDKHNISEKYNISGIPAFVFAKPSGEVIYSEAGYYGVDDFIQLTELPLAYQNGTTTAVQDLLISVEQEPDKMEENVQKFMDGNDWKTKEGAQLILSLASEGSQEANDHFDKNKAEYARVLDQESVDNFLASRALSEVIDKLQASVESKKEPDWKVVEGALKKHLDNRYQKHLYDIKAVYYLIVEEWLNYVEYAAKSVNEAAKTKTVKAELGALYLEETLKIINAENDLKRDVSSEEEVKAYKIIYPLLKKAEENLEKPTSELYSELSYACTVLDMDAESDKYDDLEAKALEAAKGK